LSSEGNYSHQGEVEKTDAYTLSVVKTDDTGMLGLVYDLAAANDPMAVAIVRSAIKRGRSVKHVALAKVLEAGKGAFLTAIFPGERLDQVLSAMAAVARDGLPPLVAASVVHDVASAVAALHDAGLAFGPFDASQVVVGYSGKSKLFGLPLSALAAHQSGKPASAFGDTKAMGALLSGIIESTDGAGAALLSVADKAIAGAFVDADDLVGALDAWLADQAERVHDEVRGWLRRRFPDRFTRWRSIATEMRGDGDRAAAAQSVVSALRAKLHAIAPTAPPTAQERVVLPTDGPRELLLPPVSGAAETIVGSSAIFDQSSPGSTDSMGSDVDHTHARARSWRRRATAWSGCWAWAGWGRCSAAAKSPSTAP
jgi:hypothetical protein